MHNLSNCTELRIFSLHANCFKGPVPASLGNLSIQLQSLLFGGNKLTGSFPSGIANLRNLNYLGLESNQFTGMVPEWLGSLQKLQRMHLNDNSFTGFIPTSLSNLSQLGYLYLGSNKFGGHIPPTLGNLQMLEALNVSNNNLHGRVPRAIFRIPAITEIDLSFNNLDGQLPSGIGNAKQLAYFKLSKNKLSGDIPNTLGNCESMENIELDSNIFSGSIPTSLSKIKGLQFLNLSNNRLTGSIPGSLGNLQFLEQLDLSFNHLEGEVPRNGIFKNATIVQIDGNQGLCGGTLGVNLVTCFIMPLKWSAKRKLAMVLNVVITVVIMVSIGVAIVVMLLRREKQNRNFITTPFGAKLPKISYNDLFKATEGFSSSNLIGKGGYSSVYKGRLFQDREVVVVKVFTLETRGAQKSFMTECALRNVRHRNLVSVLTACSSTDFRGNDFKALVYEFMPRGDLHKLLHASQNDESSSNLIYISLARRLSIVVDVSDAVAYQHHNHQGSIIHCDLKPSNILLDNVMVARVGDFGLARFKIDSAVSSPADSYSTSSVAVRGTIGYVAPECATGGQVSTASDVYSFGVIYPNNKGRNASFVVVVRP
ncbi:hypothetical protein BRADI_4g24461v3 [Brachypodium distachyon]|uniref:Protein kinase domain-containing protein n=1 Tax=Brachypodium distachyon TaxID=15368 RepID=A0A0Q3L9N8_BRADI|nr:hypothetical protein BRADI_4g24461v3 [Brachypodium distachyon]